MTIAIPQSAFAATATEAGDGTALIALRETITAIARDVEAPFIAAGAMLMQVVDLSERLEGVRGSTAMQRDRHDADTIDAVTILSEAMAILGEGSRRSAAAAQLRRDEDGRKLIAIVDSAAHRIERTLATQIRECADILAAHATNGSEPDEDGMAVLMPMLHSFGAIDRVPGGGVAGSDPGIFGVGLSRS